MTVQGGNAWRRKAQDEFESRREVPWDLTGPLDQDIRGQERPYKDPPGLMVAMRPATELQALMETAPGDTPQESLEAQQPLSDELADAIEAMDGRLRWVFQAHVNRGLSFRAIGRELGLSKSRAHELYVTAQQELARLLQDAPVTQSRLNG